MPTMRIAGILLVMLLTACAPAATPVIPTPTTPPIPTATAAIVLEDPPACAGANMLYHARLQEVLLIGCVPGSVRQSTPNIIWGWNGQRWRRVTEGGPPMRLLGGAAYDEKRGVLVLYGGYSWEKDACEHETWEWDGEGWTQKNVESPTACDHLRMVYDASRKEIVLFGGGDEKQNLRTETWAWNGQAWTKIAESEPPGRAHFGFVYDPAHEQGLLYGGYADQILQDFWAWKEGAWQPIDFPGPGPRSHFGLASDPETNALLLFGGASSTSTFSSLTDETWLLTNGAWSALDLQEHPSERGSPAMTYDPARKRIVLYGGFASDRNDLNDTWEWDGSGWDCILHCER